MAKSELDISDIKTVKQLYERLQQVYPPVEPAGTLHARCCRCAAALTLCRLDDIDVICDVLHHNRIIVMLNELDNDAIAADDPIGVKIFYIQEELIGSLYPGMTMLRTASIKDEAWSARVEIDTTAAFDVVLST